MATQTALSAGHVAPIIGALKSSILIPEVGVVVVLLVVLGFILVTNNKKKKASASPDQSQMGQYPGMGQQPNPYGAPQQSFAPAGQQDPFAGFAGAPPQQFPQQQFGAPPSPQQQTAQQFAPPPQASDPGMPPPGTPAGWLADPSGAPNTLRYWDGNGWTQHVAARS